MKNILKKIVNRKVGNSEIVEVEQLNPEEEENIFLPIASDALNITEQYNQIRMGFIFYRTKTLIRKNIMLSATRLAKKMERSKEANRGYFHRHIEAMLSYMGWFTCTDTYDCYQSRIKPYIHVGRLKKIISKIKRRQNHEGMDQGKMLRGAAGAAACG